MLLAGGGLSGGRGVRARTATGFEQTVLRSGLKHPVQELNPGLPAISGP
ncbi:hypothetical protein [Streptomyces atroolivaceus]|nr:hypothetical protein [Streptomyces atroolivaceus]